MHVVRLRKSKYLLIICIHNPKKIMERQTKQTIVVHFIVIMGDLSWPSSHWKLVINIQHFYATGYLSFLEYEIRICQIKSSNWHCKVCLDCQPVVFCSWREKENIRDSTLNGRKQWVSRLDSSLCLTDCLHRWFNAESAKQKLIRTD